VNYSGELVLWNIGQTGKGQMSILNPGSSHKGHNRIVFNIATGGQDFKTLVSVSMDRQVSIFLPGFSICTLLLCWCYVTSCVTCQLEFELTNIWFDCYAECKV